MQISKFSLLPTTFPFEPKLVHRSYEDKQGVKKYVTEIVADEMVMLDNKKDE